MTKPVCLAVAVVLTLALLTLQFLGSHESAYAQGTVNFDIDPEITGNGASTLGTIEDCGRCDVDVADMGDGLADCIVDVVVQGDTQPPVAYDASLNYDQTKVHVVPGSFATTLTAPCGSGGYPAICEVADSSGFAAAQYAYVGPPNVEWKLVQYVPDSTHIQFWVLHYAHSSGDPVYGQLATDPFIKLPGATDFTDEMPDSDGTFLAAAYYIAGGPGTAGDGTIARVGLDVIASGLVTFSLSAAPSTTYQSFASLPDSHPVTVGTGQLAINMGCPIPVGGIAQYPDIAQSSVDRPSSADESGWSARNYGALASGIAGAVLALTGGAWYARRRFSQRLS